MFQPKQGFEDKDNEDEETDASDDLEESEEISSQYWSKW